MVTRTSAEEVAGKTTEESQSPEEGTRGREEERRRKEEEDDGEVPMVSSPGPPAVKDRWVSKVPRREGDPELDKKEITESRRSQRAGES